MSTNLLVWIILAPLLGAILNGGLYFYNIKKQKISENYLKKKKKKMFKLLSLLIIDW